MRHKKTEALFPHVGKETGMTQEEMLREIDLGKLDMSSLTPEDMVVFLNLLKKGLVQRTYPQDQGASNIKTKKMPNLECTPVLTELGKKKLKEQQRA